MEPRAGIWERDVAGVAVRIGKRCHFPATL